MNWKQTIFSGLIIVVVGIAAYYGYQYLNSGAPAPVTHSATAASGGSANDLLTLLGSLQGLKFDTSFFDDRVYKSLKDVTPEIAAPEKLGKTNPFISTETGTP